MGRPLVVLVGFVTSAAALLPAAAPAQAPVKDTLSGSGHVLQTDFVTAAEAGPNGEYSGRLPRPPRNCPSPGDPPPPEMRPTGGGTFTSGDITVVDAIERLPAGAPLTRVALPKIGFALGGPFPAGHPVSLRVRVCGAPGIARLRLTQRVSPTGRIAPVWTRASWADERRQDRRCAVHRLNSPLGGSGAGRQLITVRARTTGRRWSRPAVKRVDLGRSR